MHGFQIADTVRMPLAIYLRTFLTIIMYIQYHRHHITVVTSVRVCIAIYVALLRIYTIGIDVRIQQ